MPDISKPYMFIASEKLLAKTKLADPNFKHTDWSSDDLLDLRKNLRSHYRNEQVGICCFCKHVVSLQSAHNSQVEHIAPKSLYRDFMFETKNLCVICADCNEIKRDQEVMSEVPDTVVDGSGRRLYPRSSKSFKIVHPHIDEYEEHILQVDSLYVDLSKKGHFTIGACRLNRFVHQFGWDTEILNLPKVVQMMEDFLDSSNPTDQRRKLQAIQRLMMKVKI